MARVVKLPSGLIFRDRPNRKVMGKGTPAGMKGQFGAKAIGEFIDLADKVVSSKGIGSVASAIESGFEDTPEQAKAKLKKEAAEKRAESRSLPAQQPQASATAPAVARIGPAVVEPAPTAVAPAEAQNFAQGVATVEGTQLPGVVDLRDEMAANLVRRKALATAKADEERAKADEAKAAEAAEQAALLANDAVLKRAGEIERVGTADLPVPLPEPVTPTTPPGGPAQVRTPQGAPPLAQRQTAGGLRTLAPRDAGRSRPVPSGKPSQTVPAAAGARPTPKRTLKGTIKANTQEAQEAARLIVSSLVDDIERKVPVNAATVDTAAYQVANKDAIGGAVFLAEYVKAFDELGLSKQPQAPINIPKTISAEALIGYAKTAISSENQQKVLEAFANNTVTGMGYTTLAERLSGAYRKPYLSAILSSFPKPLKAKDPIDSICNATLAYQSGMGGRLRSQREQMGYVGAQIAGQRAKAAGSAARAGLTAEQATTERELRAKRALLASAKITNALIKPQLLKIIGILKRGKGRKLKKANVAELRRATLEPITTQMKNIETRRSKVEDAITDAIASRDQISELQAAFKNTIVGSTPRAKAFAALSTARLEASKLERLTKTHERLETLHKSLSNNREPIAKILTRMAMGQRLTKEQMKTVGLTAAELAGSHFGGGRRGRKRKQTPVPRTTPPAKKAKPAKSDVTDYLD